MSEEHSSVYFELESAIVAESKEDIVKYLRQIADSIEVGTERDFIPGEGLQGYEWYVDYDYYEEDEDAEI